MIIASVATLAATRPDAGLLLESGKKYLYEERYAQAAAAIEQALRLNATLPAGHYYLGLARWKTRQLDLASAAFQQALRLDPNDDHSRYYLGRIYALRGQTQKAITVFERLAQRPAPLADEHYQLGLGYLKEGQADKALSVLRRAAELGPQSADVRSALARGYRLAGQTQEAERELKASSDLRQQDLERARLLQLCQHYLKAREFDKALEVKNQLAERAGSDELVALALLFFESGLPEQAVDLLQRAVTQDAASFEAHYNLGLTYLGQGNAPLAEKHLGQAAQLRPSSFEALSLHGLALANLKNNVRAVEVLRKALALRPDHNRILKLLALQYIEGSYNQEAIRLLAAATRARNSDPTLWFLLIQAYYKNHDFAKALQAAQNALGHFPQLARAHFEAGFQLANMGRFKEAQLRFKRTLELEPGNAEAYYWLGDLALKEGNASGAGELFRKALELNDRYVDAYGGLAKALLQLNRHAEVISAMERAIQVDSDQPQPHLYLSQAYQALGQSEKALREAEIFERLNKQRAKRRDLEGERQLPKP